MADVRAPLTDAELAEREQRPWIVTNAQLDRYADDLRASRAENERLRKRNDLLRAEQ